MRSPSGESLRLGYDPVAFAQLAPNNEAPINLLGERVVPELR